MKQTMIIILCMVLLVGCSTKSSYMKKGAIVGGVGTAVTIAALASKDANSDYAGEIAMVAIIMGLAGTSLGAGVGYLMDEATKSSQDKKMQEMIQSQKIQGL